MNVTSVDNLLQNFEYVGGESIESIVLDFLPHAMDGADQRTGDGTGQRALVNVERYRVSGGRSA